MATDKVENKIFHIYLQLGFIIPSTFLLIRSECIHWFSCVSIPFLFGVLPALILIMMLKKAKSRKEMDYSSSDTDSSDGGEKRRLPATTKASLNQTKSVFAPVLYQTEVDQKDGFLDGMMSMDTSKLKADLLNLKKKKVDYEADNKRDTHYEDDNSFVEQELHTKELHSKEKSVINRRKNKKKKLDNSQIGNKKGEIMEIDRNLKEKRAEDDENKFDKEFKNKNVDDVKDKEIKQQKRSSKRSKSQSLRKKISGKKRKAAVKKLVNTEQPAPEHSTETVDDEAEAGPSQQSPHKTPFKPFVLNYDEEYSSTATDSTSQDETNEDAKSVIPDKPIQSKDSDMEDKKSTKDSTDDIKEESSASDAANEDTQA